VAYVATRSMRIVSGPWAQVVTCCLQAFIWQSPKIRLGRRLATPPTVPEHAHKIRFACLTTYFISIAWLFHSAVAFWCTHNVAGSCFCALSCCPERHCARARQQHGPIPCRFEPQSGLTVPENRLSLGEGLLTVHLCIRFPPSCAKCPRVDTNRDGLSNPGHLGLSLRCCGMLSFSGEG
jgi:hypothetical protein